MTDPVELFNLDDEDEEEKEDEAASMMSPLAKQFAEARAILVSETVTDKLARKVLHQAIALEQDDPTAPVWVYINSPGGSADSGFAIYDTLRFIKPPVRTIVTGLCASAAVTIFLAGDEEHRYSMPSARFLLHQPSSASRGSASDIEITAKEIMRLRKKYNEMICDVTGKDLETVEQDSDRDFWMSADEAEEYGLVDQIIAHRGEIE